MIEVSVLAASHEPAGSGLVFQLLSGDGTVISSAATDDEGVVTFDVDSVGLGPLAISLSTVQADASGDPS